ncbi:concanavalin A-like lectin/glucanase domain-containing protein [Scheffersomyces coipomensis]|uniref:concanavalin A-like lectin/glucanase domain-containing protein n=1 Tax=Scheffersomyces coipomensis TaxID=1788519 RepID=UPI00315DF572
MKLSILTLLMLIPFICGEEYDDEELPPPCNPKTDKKCLARDTALGAAIIDPLTSDSSNFYPVTGPDGIEYCDEGMKLNIRKRFDNPSVMSDFYILYGKVSLDLKAAPGKGIISSFYLQSDDLDEIDIAEIFGGDIYEYQTNFFVKGNTTTYSRGGYHPVAQSPMEDFHNYGVEWTPDRIEWSLDGVVTRVLEKENPEGFPASPMFVKVSLWSGGDPSNEEGTILWAGGETDYVGLPYSMYAKDLNVIDYSSGSEYVYGYNSDGNWINLTAKKGKIFGDNENRQSSPTQQQNSPFIIEIPQLDSDVVTQIDDLDDISDFEGVEYEYEVLYEDDLSPVFDSETTTTTTTTSANDKRFIQFFNNSINASINISHQLSTSFQSIINILLVEGIFFWIWL